MLLLGFKRLVTAVVVGGGAQLLVTGLFVGCLGAVGFDVETLLPAGGYFQEKVLLVRPFGVECADFLHILLFYR